MKALKAFEDMLMNDPDRACYGYKQVILAGEKGAIEILLILDKIYRSKDFDQRNRLVALIDSVKACGGKIYKLSAMHSTGEKLESLTGIAALLRFPLPDLDDEAEAAVDIPNLVT